MGKLFYRASVMHSHADCDTGMARLSIHHMVLLC